MQPCRLNVTESRHIPKQESAFCICSEYTLGLWRTQQWPKADPEQTPILKADPQSRPSNENKQMSLWMYLEYTRSRLTPDGKIKDGSASHFMAVHKVDLRAEPE